MCKGLHCVLCIGCGRPGVHKRFPLKNTFVCNLQKIGSHTGIVNVRGEASCEGRHLFVDIARLD